MSEWQELGGTPGLPRYHQRTILGGAVPSFASLASALGIPEKRKVFISYHHHGDQDYKNALSLYCDDYELLDDNSIDRLIDTDDLKYVEREIREDYIKGASVTIVLCGAQTWERKFVDWEIYATLLKCAGLVGIQLPTLAPDDATGKLIVPARLHDNIQTGYAVWRTWSAMVAAPGVLRTWVEEALAKESWRIDNSRPKMRRNSEVREHP